MEMTQDAVNRLVTRLDAMDQAVAADWTPPMPPMSEGGTFPLVKR